MGKYADRSSVDYAYSVTIIIRTFCSNIKCSLLKLLCTLTHLYKVTPLQPLIFDFFLIDFPSHTRSQLPFLTLHRQARQHNKGKDAQIPWARSAPQPAHPRDIATHPIYHLSTAKVSSTPPPRNCTPLEECFPCILWHIYLFTHFVIPSLLPWWER